jgi:hypothetical protein
LHLPLVLLLVLVFLVPIAAYCLILATINRRLHPVMVAGAWDAAGLLCAASGGLIFVGPAIIAVFYRRSVSEVPAEGASMPSFAELFTQWWLAWLIYLVVVIGGAILLLWLRRRKTMIYNVVPEDFDRLLVQLLDRLGLEWNRLGNRVFIAAGREAARAVGVEYREAYAADALVAAEIVPMAAPPRPAGEAVVDLEPFHTMCHVTLHWRRHSGLVREEVEAELDRALAHLPAPEHPTAGWLMGVAAFLLALIFMGILIALLGGVFLQRH